MPAKNSPKTSKKSPAKKRAVRKRSQLLYPNLHPGTPRRYYKKVRAAVGPGTKPAVVRDLVSGRLKDRDRRRGAEKQISDLQKQLGKAQKHIDTEARRLNDARERSAEYYQRMMRAKTPRELSNQAVRGLPSEFGSHGMMLIRDPKNGEWVGHIARLSSDPDHRKVEHFTKPRLTMDSFVRKGDRIVRLDVSDISSILPYNLVKKLGNPNSAAVKKVGKNAFFVVFNPSETAKTGLMTRMSRRSAAARSRLATLRAESKNRNMAVAAARMRDMALVGTLSRFVGHEVRNNLVTIGGWANNLANHAGLDANAKEKAERIRMAADDAMQIAEDVRNLTEMKDHFKKLDVREPLIKAVAENRQLLHSLEVMPPVERLKKPPAIIGAEPALTRTFSNLIRNAADEVAKLPPDQRRLRIEIATKKKGEQDFLRVRIQNNGEPMPSPVRSNLFGIGVTSKGEEGTGLGLVLSKWVVEEHGGTLHYHPRGLGHEFHVDIPVSHKE
jgi:signal transduction histidine kinase